MENTFSNNKKAAKYASDKKTIVCRVESCKQSLLAKNYCQHLPDQHPAENHQDLSPFGQTRIIFFAAGTSGSKTMWPELAVTNELTRPSVKTSRISDEMSLDFMQEQNQIDINVGKDKSSTSVASTSSLSADNN